MSEHKAIIRWELRGGGVSSVHFKQGRFSREHTWTFDGGATVQASASPAVVPAPWSNPAGVDPEEAFVASISSCHMLTYIWLVSRKGFDVGFYEDEAVGTMTKNEKGVPWISEVILHPKIIYGGPTKPTPEQEEHLHHQAHEQCFIAQSVKTTVKVAGAGH